MCSWANISMAWERLNVARHKTRVQLTLESAVRAVREYNRGIYAKVGRPNIDIDREADQLFANGLGATAAEVEEQLRFTGKMYGGVAGFQRALEIAPDIGVEIHRCREHLGGLATSARSLVECISNSHTLRPLYDVFVRECCGKRNWQVWCSKFWHLVNPHAFPIEDRFARDTLGTSKVNSFRTYVVYLTRFHEFTASRASWLPALRHSDEAGSRSDLKLWDKVFYEVGAKGRC